jgi:hypothetical protein
VFLAQRRQPRGIARQAGGDLLWCCGDVCRS